MTGEPCFRCGARPDVDCGHREVDAEWIKPRFVDRIDRRKVAISGGGNYRMDGRRGSKHA